ncbi:MAG: helix-turn-helix domain-containing protein [Muribaculaceae bacterium]|nr:helix-turn-helix domain-containing protein [Muribaculaceae bacterium]
MKIIKGNKALAAELGVSPGTVGKWKAQGVLKPAILAEYCRIILYDLDKVFGCLQHKPNNIGRPRKLGQ